jgi:uncharacterized membrane protein
MGQIKIEPQGNPIIPIIIVMILTTLGLLVLNFGYTWLKALWNSRPSSSGHRHKKHKKRKKREESSEEESSSE